MDHNSLPLFYVSIYAIRETIRTNLFPRLWSTNKGTLTSTWRRRGLVKRRSLPFFFFSHTHTHTQSNLFIRIYPFPTRILPKGEYDFLNTRIKTDPFLSYELLLLSYGYFFLPIRTITSSMPVFDTYIISIFFWALKYSRLEEIRYPMRAGILYQEDLSEPRRIFLPPQADAKTKR